MNAVFTPVGLIAGLVAGQLSSWPGEERPEPE